MNLSISKLESFKDGRGEFVKLWSSSGERGMFWTEDDVSVNHKGVLRGLHGDGATWKLVTCVYGTVFFAAVDSGARKQRHLLLSDKNRLQVEIPPMFAVGYQALTEPAIIHYKQSNRYGHAPAQFTLPWDGYGIPWPIKKPILSERDKNPGGE